MSPSCRHERRGSSPSYHSERGSSMTWGSGSPFTCHPEGGSPTTESKDLPRVGSASLVSVSRRSSGNAAYVALRASRNSSTPRLGAVSLPMTNSPETRDWQAGSLPLQRRSTNCRGELPACPSETSMLAMSSLVLSACTVLNNPWQHEMAACAIPEVGVARGVAVLRVTGLVRLSEAFQ
jgi:hypothetical protein